MQGRGQGEGGLFSAILMRIADAVQPFDFHFVHQFLLLPSLEEVRDGFGQQPDLFDQFKQNQADEFKYFHGRFFVAAGQRSCHR